MSQLQNVELRNRGGTHFTLVFPIIFENDRSWNQKTRPLDAIKLESRNMHHIHIVQGRMRLYSHILSSSLTRLDSLSIIQTYANFEPAELVARREIIKHQVGKPDQINISCLVMRRDLTASPILVTELYC